MLDHINRRADNLDVLSINELLSGDADVREKLSLNKKYVGDELSRVIDLALQTMRDVEEHLKPYLS